MVNAREVCQQIAAVQGKVSALLPSITASATSPDDLLVKLLLAASLTPQQIETLRTKTGSTSVTACNNSSAIAQSNVFDSEVCARVLGCMNRRDPVYIAELTQLLGPAQADKQLALLKEMCTFNVTQSNSASTVQQCNLQQTLSLLQQQPFDPVLQGVLNALSSGVAVDCSAVPTTATSSAYEKAYAHCQNYAELSQSNIARCASAQQSNASTVLQSCVGNAVLQTDAIAAATSATPTTTTITTTPTSSNGSTTTTTSSGSTVLVAVVAGAALLVLLLLSRRRRRRAD